MARVVTLYRRIPDGLERRDVPEWVATTTLHSGGGGLWSTARDYLQFAQMLVNRGELNATRLLGPRTVDLMASNHVGDLYEKAGRTGGGPGKGFGLTVDVVLDAVAARGDHRSTGSFGWSGAFRHHLLGRSPGGDDRDSDGADAGRSPSGPTSRTR